MPSKHKVGDIILTVKTRKFGEYISGYQKLARRGDIPQAIIDRGFWPTHAALVVTSSVIAQSNRGSGVTLEGIDSFFASQSPETLLGLRHPGVSAQGFSELDILRGALRYLDQVYNRPIISSEKDSASFCSEFIYKVFRDLKLELPDRDPHKVFPLDYLIWAQSRGWEILEGPHIWELPFTMPDDSYLSDTSARLYIAVHRRLVRSTINMRLIQAVLAEGAEEISKLIDVLEAGAHIPSHIVVDPQDHPLTGVAVYEAAQQISKGLGDVDTSTDRDDLTPTEIMHWSLDRLLDPPDARAKLKDVEIKMSRLILDEADRISTLIIENLKEIVQLASPGTPVGDKDAPDMRGQPDRLSTLLGNCATCVKFIDFSEGAEVIETRLKHAERKIGELTSLWNEHVQSMKKTLDSHARENPGQLIAFSMYKGDLVAQLRTVCMIVPLLTYHQFDQLRLFMSKLGSVEDIVNLFEQGPNKCPEDFVGIARVLISTGDYENSMLDFVNSVHQSIAEIVTPKPLDSNSSVPS